MTTSSRFAQTGRLIRMLQASERPSRPAVPGISSRPKGTVKKPDRLIDSMQCVVLFLKEKKKGKIKGVLVLNGGGNVHCLLDRSF